jgi:hypothetical protein
MTIPGVKRSRIPFVYTHPLWSAGDWKGRLLAPPPLGDGSAPAWPGKWNYGCGCILISMRRVNERTDRGSQSLSVRCDWWVPFEGVRRGVQARPAEVLPTKGFSCCERVVTHVRPPSSIFGYPDTPSLRYPRNPHETAGSTTSSRFA